MQRHFSMPLLVPALLALALPMARGNAASNPPGAKPETNSSVAGKPTGKGGTNTAPAELPIPQSVFVIPQTREEGIDPFFPRSERFRALRPTTNPTNSPAPVVLDFSIKGFSGSAAFPLVIINDKTFAAGDEKEVVTAQGRARVRCVEIRLAEEIAVIEAAGVRRELRFRRGK